MSTGTLQGITAGTILCWSLTAVAQPPQPVSGVIRFYGQLVVGPCDLSPAQLAGVAAGVQDLPLAGPCRRVDPQKIGVVKVAQMARVVVVDYE